MLITEAETDRTRTVFHTFQIRVDVEWPGYPAIASSNRRSEEYDRCTKHVGHPPTVAA